MINTIELTYTSTESHEYLSILFFFVSNVNWIIYKIKMKLIFKWFIVDVYKWK